MARKRVLLMVSLLTVVALALPGQDASGVAESLRARGYTVENPRTDAGRPTWDLRHEERIPFTLSMVGPLTEARALALQSIRETVFSLEGLDIRRTRIVFDQDRATAVVAPRSYRINGREYSGYMPSGMQFMYDESLAFDFRMLADNLALRVNGQYLTEEQFRERIVRAIDNPAAYIESSDPQFLARRLEEQQSLLDGARATDIIQNQAIARLEDEIARSLQLGEEALNREVRRAEQAERAVRRDFQRDLAEEAETLRKETQLALAELSARHEALRADHEALLQAQGQLLAEFEALREGAIALAGRKLFGALRELDPGAVARVVELRRAEPGLEADDARDRVNDELPDGVDPLHSRHVQAIYALYFNDYR
ncbi:MAG: hypothetical protein EA427_04370 [Spirochaetaceae bacterium]|nr:MAG: hypothetical protein EA427_04370 [Spirochaetaceae bacterium]